MTLPNQLTILRILLTPVFVILFISERLIFKQTSVVIFALAALTDWYDGWVARKLGKVSRWGIFLDPLADKVLTSAAFVAFAWLGMVEAWMVWVIVVRDISITLLRSFAELGHHTMRTNYSAKVKTFAQMAFIYAVLLAVVLKDSAPAISLIAKTILDKNVLNYSMLVVTVLTFGTGVQYLIENYKVIHSSLRGMSGRAESE